ncbi:MAG: hypothetical protein BWZ02_03087 [Lentisphaerae bacterium ADurb.BinA184]|nr:MAG: hypothetical protein BWZ02_03087 [Lentisphaerae bacterium ADurb.BinA184]
MAGNAISCIVTDSPARFCSSASVRASGAVWVWVAFRMIASGASSGSAETTRLRTSHLRLSAIDTRSQLTRTMAASGASPPASARTVAVTGSCTPSETRA